MIVIRSNGADTTPCWTGIELQGTLAQKDGATDVAARDIGRLEVDASGKRATMHIGNHLLKGSRVALKKPLLVTRKRTGRSTTTEDATGATVGVAAAGHASKKKKPPKDMADFYHFQQHEKKREQLAQLREQFQQDRERIARMRADRKFKPQGY